MFGRGLLSSPRRLRLKAARLPLLILAAILAFARPLPAAQPAPRPAQPAIAPVRADIPESVRAYAQLPFLSEARLSPDGRRIAARVSEGGIDKISVWIAGGQADQQPITLLSENVESIRWAGDNHILVAVIVFAVRTENGTFYMGPSRRIVKWDLRTRKPSILGTSAGVYDDVIFIDPEARYVLLASQTSINQTPSVLRVDLATNTSAVVERPRKGVWSWHADGNGVVRVGVDYGENRTRIFYRDAAGQPLRRIETRRNLGDESVIDDLRFVGGGGRGIIVTNAATGRFGVYAYDFATDTRGEPLFEHPVADVTEAYFAPDGALEGVRYDEDRPRFHWRNPELAELQETIDRAFPNKTNTIVNRSRDGNRVLVWSAAADDPGTYYVFDRAARRMETFASPYDLLAEMPHSQVRPISYRSRDGLTIRGYLTLPRGRAERGLPLIVLPHGGPFLRDNWVFDPDVQFLASQGYAVLQANFRGSTGYGRDFVARGFGQLGAGMINDLEDGVDWLAGQGTIDRARVCMMGYSYGGYAAIWAATRNPARYRCAISFAGPSDIRTMLRHTGRGFTARRYFRAYRQQIEGNPAVDLDAISPWRQAARLRVPALIAHGRNDRIVPVEQSERLVQALSRARVPSIETIFYEKSGHNFALVAEREDFLNRVASFLKRHNPADATPPAS